MAVQRHASATTRAGSRLGHSFVMLVFFPFSLFLLIRNSNSAALAVIFGNAGSGSGMDNDLIKHGGLLSDDTPVLAGYVDITQSNQQLPEGAMVDATDIELLTHLDSRIALKNHELDNLRRRF